MSNFRSRLPKVHFAFRKVRSFRSLLPRSVAVALATLFIGLAISAGIGLTQDFHRQSEVRDSANQKRLLTLVGEVELGNAVQDFKDCLLRNDSSYCDDFERHIQVLERTLTLYEAQAAEQPDERKTLTTLRQAFSNYESSVVAMRDMQSRHMTIREIDAAVKGADRPIAAGLRELATLSNRHAETHTPVGRSLGLASCVILAALFLYLSFPTSTRAGNRALGSAPLLPQLSGRLFAWEEERKANAFLRLHDGVCQSLTGIMYFLKSTQLTAAGDVPESVIPSLQAVIQDTRAVALQLRPPRIQDAGLLATLYSLWVDARSLNATLAIKPRLLVDECEIPEGLKPVILRIARVMVDATGQSATASCLAWGLERTGQKLRLSIDATFDTDGQPGQSDRHTESSTAAHSGFDAVQALVVLSGGNLDRVHYGYPSKTLVCSWALTECE